MKTKIFNIKILIFSILFILIMTSFLKAQGTQQNNSSKKINEMMVKLTNKLLLTNTQKDKIKSVLEEYFNGRQTLTDNGKKLAELQNTSENKIVNLLDSKQKMKYSIIKEEWWALASQ